MADDNWLIINLLMLEEYDQLEARLDKVEERYGKDDYSDETRRRLHVARANVRQTISACQPNGNVAASVN